MAFTITLTNLGDPLLRPDATAYANTKVKFLLVDANQEPVDVIDAITNEVIFGFATTTTNDSGIFTDIELFPNDRGHVFSQYLCTIEAYGATPFVASIASTPDPLTFADFKANGAPLTPAEISALNTHIADMTVHIDSGVANALLVPRIVAGGGAIEYVPQGASTDDTLPILSIGFSPTAYLRSILNDVGSAGWIEGFEITDAGGGNVDRAAGEYRIRSGSTPTSPLYYVAIGAQTGISIPTNTTRYLIGNYNAGSPTATFQASDTSNGYDIIYLGEVHNVNGTLMIHSDPRPVGDAVNRIQKWAVNVIGDRVSSGNVTYDPAAPSLKIAVTAGEIEVARSLTTQSQGLFDSNAGGTFTAIYGTSTYTYVPAQTLIDNTQYDNAGVLTTMTAGWYSNRYPIRGYNGAVVVQYGRAQYATEAEALAEATPADRPEEYMEHGMVIAKITIQNGATSPSTITDLRPVINSSAPTPLSPTDHNGLTSLQGGTSAQYYHLTAAEYTGYGTGVFVRQSAIGATVNSTTTVATLTPSLGLGDTIERLTAQVGNLAIANPSTTPSDGQMLEIDGYSVAGATITSWGTMYEANASLALPTSFAAGAGKSIFFEYSASTSKLRLISVVTRSGA